MLAARLGSESFDREDCDDAVVRAICAIFGQGYLAGAEEAAEKFWSTLSRYVDAHPENSWEMHAAIEIATEIAKLGNEGIRQIAQVRLIDRIMALRLLPNFLAANQVLLFAMRLSATEEGAILLFSRSPASFGTLIRLADMDAELSCWRDELWRDARNFMWLLSTRVRDAKNPDLALVLARCPDFGCLWDVRPDFSKLWLLYEVVARLNYEQLGYIVDVSLVRSVTSAVSRNPKEPGTACMALKIILNILTAERRTNGAEWRHVPEQ